MRAWTPLFRASAGSGNSFFPHRQQRGGTLDCKHMLSIWNTTYEAQTHGVMTLIGWGVMRLRSYEGKGVKGLNDWGLKGLLESFPRSCKNLKWWGYMDFGFRFSDPGNRTLHSSTLCVNEFFKLDLYRKLTLLCRNMIKCTRSPVKLSFYTVLIHERIFWLNRFILGHLYTIWFCDKNFGSKPRQIFGGRCQKSYERGLWLSNGF